MPKIALYIALAWCDVRRSRSTLL